VPKWSSLHAVGDAVAVGVDIAARGEEEEGGVRRGHGGGGERGHGLHRPGVVPERPGGGVRPGEDVHRQVAGGVEGEAEAARIRRRDEGEGDAVGVGGGHGGGGAGRPVGGRRAEVLQVLVEALGGNQGQSQFDPVAGAFAVPAFQVRAGQPSGRIPVGRARPRLRVVGRHGARAHRKAAGGCDPDAGGALGLDDAQRPGRDAGKRPGRRRVGQGGKGGGIEGNRRMRDAETDSAGRIAGRRSRERAVFRGDERVEVGPAGQVRPGARRRRKEEPSQTPCRTQAPSQSSQPSQHVVLPFRGLRRHSAGRRRRRPATTASILHGRRRCQTGIAPP
jgi:hypothetical protein